MKRKGGLCHLRFDGRLFSMRKRFLFQVNQSAINTKLKLTHLEIGYTVRIAWNYWWAKDPCRPLCRRRRGSAFSVPISLQNLTACFNLVPTGPLKYTSFSIIQHVPDALLLTFLLVPVAEFSTPGIPTAIKSAFV